MTSTIIAASGSRTGEMRARSQDEMGRALVIAGLVLVAVGLLVAQLE
jgi:hypothetical protein